MHFPYTMSLEMHPLYRIDLKLSIEQTAQIDGWCIFPKNLVFHMQERDDVQIDTTGPLTREQASRFAA